MYWIAILAIPLAAIVAGCALARHFKRKGKRDHANYATVLTIVVVLLYARLTWRAFVLPFQGQP